MPLQGHAVCACTDYHYFSKGVCHEGIACASYQYEGVCACPYELIINMKAIPQCPGSMYMIRVGHKVCHVCDHI